MTSCQSNFYEKKSLNDFLADNLPNQIIYNCIKRNTDIPDDSIRQGFADAYNIGREVVSCLNLHTHRSKSFVNMANSFNQSSLLSHSIVYSILSFHKDAPRLGQYLSNLKPVLEERYNDVFLPILMVTISTAPILPDTVSFQPRGEVPAIPSPIEINVPSLPYSEIFSHLKFLNKIEGPIVIKFLKRIMADINQDYQEILNIEEKRFREMPDDQFRSKFTLSNGQKTNFCKVILTLYRSHMFSAVDKLYASNFEDLMDDFFYFLNLEPSDYWALLSEAKDTNCFMDIFDKMSSHAQQFLEEEKETPKKKHITKPNNPSLF